MTAWTSEPPREGAGYDPKVYTSDLPSTPGWYVVNGSGPMEFQIDRNGVVSFGPDERQMLWSYAASHGAARSILPIPSAEVLAAMEALAEACAHADRDARMLRSEYLWRSRISAALRALEEARRG